MTQTFLIKAPCVYDPPVNGIKIFKQKPLCLMDNVSRWRSMAKDAGLSTKAMLRLEWMIFYETVGNHSASVTAKHFDITPKTFYKWFKRFDNGRVKLLEEGSRAPINRRKPEITFKEECRIRKLREDHLHWGKRKIAKLYKDEHNEVISSHKVQLVINKFNLYPDKIKHDKLKKKLKSQKQKNRIQKLEIKEEHWFLFHLDTIVFYWSGAKRYILTAIDHHGKIAYARMYKNKSSKSAKDFLYRLHYLVDAKITNIQTDNGSEFYDQFEDALKQLEILHWFSRPRTPQDNSIVERFNQTIQDEWINDGNFTTDIDKFNRNLTYWLEEYNFLRPHESLDYKNPFEYYLETLENNKNLLPMYSACTIY